MWVEGYFHDDTKLKDKRPLTVRDLDQVSTDHPVVVQHRGGHTSFYNSKAFELAGITKDTPNPEGGTFDRDANGNLTGRVTDRARSAMGRAGRRPTFTPSRVAQRSRAGTRAHLEAIRAVRPDQRASLRAAISRHCGMSAPASDLHHRVSFELAGGALNSAIADGTKSGDGDDWIRIGVDDRTHGRRLVLRADDGDERAVQGHRPAVQGQRHRVAGHAECLGRARASRRHPGELPRERRRGDRHVPDGARARAEAGAARRTRVRRSRTAR